MPSWAKEVFLLRLEELVVVVAKRREPLSFVGVAEEHERRKRLSQLAEINHLEPLLANLLEQQPSTCVVEQHS